METFSKYTLDMITTTNASAFIVENFCIIISVCVRLSVSIHCHLALRSSIVSIFLFISHSIYGIILRLKILRVSDTFDKLSNDSRNNEINIWPNRLGAQSKFATISFVCVPVCVMIGKNANNRIDSAKWQITLIALIKWTIFYALFIFIVVPNSQHKKTPPKERQRQKTAKWNWMSCSTINSNAPLFNFSTNCDAKLISV